MRIFTLTEVTPDYFKPRGYQYDFILNKYQTVVVQDALAAELIGDGMAKPSEGEMYILNETIYDPINSPYNPLGDYEPDADAAEEYPLPPIDPVTGK